MSNDSQMDELLELLQSENPRIRRKACDDLGKLGNPESITELVALYEQIDEDPRVREAAKKALRRFANQESGGGSPLLRNLGGLLVVTFVVLLVLNVVLRLGGGGGEPATVVLPTPVPREDLIAQSNMVLLAAAGDIQLLRDEWGAGAGLLPCTAQLQRPQAMALTPLERAVYPDFTFVDNLRATLVMLDNVANAWAIACDSPEKGTETQVQNALSALNDVETRLNELGFAIFEVEQNPAATIDPASLTVEPPTSTPAPTNTAAATAPPTATATITNTPAPTLDPNLMRDLDRIVANTTTEVGALLNQRWIPVQDGGASPFGCSGVRIEADYPPASPELAANEPDLAGAIEVLNAALGLARSSASSYETNCLNSTMNPTIIAAGIADAEQALETLDLAKQVLDDLKAR